MNRSSQEVAGLITRAESLISRGKPTKDACKEVGIQTSVLYSARSKAKKRANAKSPRKLLNITELPSFVPHVGNLFMVYGSPAMLASFAKGMQ